MRFITLACIAIGLLCARLVDAQTTQPIGQITAAFGKAEIHSAHAARRADVFSTFKNDECVKTMDAGLSLLMRTRLVVKLDAQTCVRFSEGTGQTHLQLEEGTVQIFAGKRAAYWGDASVQDALVRLDGKNSVFFASYDPTTRSGYYACEHGSVVIESAADQKRYTLNEDQQAIASEGKAMVISQLDRETYSKHQRTLQRLGQSVIAQGSETTRTRSSAFDTRNAIAQLEAAGWIDQETLTAARPLVKSTAESSDSVKAKESQIASSSGGSSSGGSDVATDVVTEPPATPASDSGSISQPSANSASGSSSNSGTPNSSGSSSPPVNPPRTEVAVANPVEPSEPSQPSIEVPQPREVVTETSNDVGADSVDSLPRAKQESSNETPQVEIAKPATVDQDNDKHDLKLPKAEKVDKDNGGSKIDLPKAEKIEKSNKGKKNDVPDLKIPKIEKTKGGPDLDAKELKEITKAAREKVEKNDNKGKKGKGKD